MVQELRLSIRVDIYHTRMYVGMHTCMLERACMEKPWGCSDILVQVIECKFMASKEKSSLRVMKFSEQIFQHRFAYPDMCDVVEVARRDDGSEVTYIADDALAFYSLYPASWLEKEAK